jgi:hypothetical protein
MRTLFMKSAATVVPMLFFAGALVLCWINIEAVDGPISQVHARTRDYAHALVHGDLEKARAFHAGSGPPSGRYEGAAFRIDDVVEEVGTDGTVHVFATVLWSDGAPLRLEWVQGPGGDWEILGARQEGGGFLEFGHHRPGSDVSRSVPRLGTA